MPGFLASRSKIRSVFLRALETICSVSLYPKQKPGLFFCEHWKRHAWISCIQIKNQVCFLASIGNDMLGLFVSKTKTRCVFLRALQKMFGYLHAKTKITCIFLTKTKNTSYFSNDSSPRTGSFTTATCFLGFQNHKHTYRGRSTIMIPSTLTPRTTYCYHWTLLV